MNVVYRGGYVNQMKSSKPAGQSKVFALAAANAITAFSGQRDGRRDLGDGDVLFASPDELRHIPAEWPSTRLVLLWNSIPGVVPVKKFTDRPTALKRIWAAIQPIEPIR